MTSRVLSFGGVEGKAGLILNNGSLTGGAVDFGTNKGYIYASGPDSSIASAIRGSGGIIFTGLPGTKVKLTSWETTYSTRLTVAGTTLELPNLTVMGESGTPITLDGGGTLLFPNPLNFTRDLTFGSGGAAIEVAADKTVVSSGAFSGSGPIRKSGAGYLKLNGAGTATGAVTIDGDLTLMEGSTCHAYVKGAVGASSDGTGSNHSQILVTGAGVVAGTLKLVVDAAYTPATGDEIFVMLRNGGSGAFSKVVVVEDSTTIPDQPRAQGSPITIKGKAGTVRYNSHSSINLSSPAGAYDVSIKFQ